MVKSQRISGRVAVCLLLGLSFFFLGGCRAARTAETFEFGGAAGATLLPTGSTATQAGLPFTVSTASTITGTLTASSATSGSATPRFVYQTSPAPILPTATPTTPVYAGTLTPGTRQPTATLTPGTRQPTATFTPGTRQSTGTLTPGTRQPTATLTITPNSTLPATALPSPTATATNVPSDPWRGSWLFYAEINPDDYQNAQAELKVENGTASGTFNLNGESFSFMGDFIQNPQTLNGVYTWGNTNGWFSWKISADGLFFQGSLDNKTPFCAARFGVQRPEPCAYYAPY